MIELDVRLSRDGRLVMIHDERIDRTADGTGAVTELTLAELKHYNDIESIRKRIPIGLPPFKRAKTIWFFPLKD
jgi:glycerophosphoryl diester phosphodiesterase